MSYFLLGSIVFLISLFVLVRFLEAKSVFYPLRTLNFNPSHFQLPWDDVWLTTSDGVRLNGWMVKNDSAKSIVLFSHGNAGNMSDRLLKIKFFHDLGCAVFIYDYRGFGKSEGTPSEAGIYRDVQAAFDWIKAQPSSQRKNIIAYGASLGGIVSIDLASHRNVDALIVDSSITSAKDMGKILYPILPTFFMSLQFDSINKINKIAVPKLFIHSPDDRIVPFSMGESLFKAAQDPKHFIKTRGGHNDSQITQDPQAFALFLEFLRKYHFI